MFPTYTVIDVETPNRKNDSICSIALVHVANGKPERKIYKLVNPEDRFDKPNMEIHKITPAMVKNQPTFYDVWMEIQEYLIGQIVVAHNAAFDLSVISKAISKYVPEIPVFSFVCTLQLARDLLGDNTGYGLKDLCDQFGIDQGVHHNALDDALACGNLFQLVCSKYDFDIEQQINQYCYQKVSIANTKTSPKASMKELVEFAQDILSDEFLSDKKILKIHEWLIENEHLCGQFPYNDLFNTCEDILADGIITEEERLYFTLLLSEFLSPSAIDAKPQNLDIIAGKCFCLSGNFSSGTKTSIENTIVSLGGQCAKTVTKKTDILLVGDVGDTRWLYGNYGSKVAKALQMQEKGHHIQILAETSFTEAFKGD